MYTMAATNRAIDGSCAAAERLDLQPPRSLIRPQSSLEQSHGLMEQQWRPAQHEGVGEALWCPSAGRLQEDSSGEAERSPRSLCRRLPRPPMIAVMTALSSQSAPSVGSAVAAHGDQDGGHAGEPAYANAPEMTVRPHTHQPRLETPAAPRAMPNNVRLNTSAGRQHDDRRGDRHEVRRFNRTPPDLQCRTPTRVRGTSSSWATRGSATARATGAR